MPNVYSSKSTPIVFADVRSAELWQQHIVDGRNDIVVNRDELGYVTVRPWGDIFINEDDFTYETLRDRFTIADAPASLLDEIAVPVVCGDRLSRYADAFAQGFYRE